MAAFIDELLAKAGICQTAAELEEPEFASAKEVESETTTDVPDNLDMQEEEPEVEEVVPVPVVASTVQPVTVLLKSVDANNNEIIDMSFKIIRINGNCWMCHKITP